MMSREGKFLIYCVETYKVAKNLTGKQVAEIFTCLLYTSKGKRIHRRR